MNTELAAEIRNKLTPAKTALELLLKAEKVPEEFLEKAIINLDEVVRLVENK